MLSMTGQSYCPYSLLGETAAEDVPTRSHTSEHTGDPPAPTSHISAKHAVEVTESFDEFKRWLATTILADQPRSNSMGNVLFC